MQRLLFGEPSNNHQSKVYAESSCWKQFLWSVPTQEIPEPKNWVMFTLAN
jgi:hypothetical protein